MHGQGNNSTSVRQGPYPPPSEFQQRPACPPTFHHRPLTPQPQVVQQGNPPFHLRPPILAYQHGIAGAPPPGPPPPVVSSGTSPVQSYLTHPRPLQGHVSPQISHSFPTSEQQQFPWSHNVHQVPPKAPLPAPSAYPLPSSQGHNMGRGPPLLAAPHTPPPPPPPYSNSIFLLPDPHGSFAFATRQHSNPHSTGPLLPPPPPPPSSPPGVPPLPPSSPTSDNKSKSDTSHSLKEDLLGRDNLMLESLPLAKIPEDRSSHKIEVLCQYTENYVPKVESVEAVVPHPDSDMDMEG